MQKLACRGCMLALWLTGVVYAQNESCSKLAQMALPQAAIVSSSVVPAGSFSPPAGLPSFLTNIPYKAVPEFCRVVVAGHPSADSDIRIEVWMPASGWNGKLQGQGNGGFAGYVDYPGLAVYVSRGYASVSTDTGHSAAGEAPDASWALGHPQKVVDYGYRAIHQMTELAKTIVAAFYGTKPRYSYFASCSNGGRQALMEAQRYPEDYDGILAGAPANYWTHLLTNALWNAQSTASDAASYIPSSKLPAIAAAVNTACDAQDGVKDGVLNDPRQCRFDPAVMLCKNGDSDQCLTQPQTVALRKLYEGAHDASGQIFPGFLPGAEEGGPGGWKVWITGQGPGRAALFYFAQGFFADMVYEKPDWNYKTADLSQAVRDADTKQAPNLNATDPNLESFRSRGGKLILYHGWNDPAIPALNTVNYYNAVLKQMGQANSESFLRLYMVPGMQHCGGGPGATAFGQNGVGQAQDPEHNIRAALEQWVEKGTAPSKIVASKYHDGPPQPEMPKAEMTRPLCPYPLSAKFKGSGDPNREESFVCRVPQP